MITAYIFSRDRGAQLDCLLTSLEQNLPGLFEPYVVWKASDQSYARGYKRVGELHPGAVMVEESLGPRGDFVRGCERAIEKSYGQLVGIFTDDCVCFRPARISPEDVGAILVDGAVLCASLRLGLNTVVQDYTTGRLQPELRTASPRKIHGDADSESWMEWPYEKFLYTDNYGYIGAMDATVYRAWDVLGWLKEMTGMRTYRDFEGAIHLWQNRRELAQSRPLMACPEQSVVINVPCNSVQVEPTLSGTTHHYSTAFLNEQLLAGRRINPARIAFGDVRSCHAEFALPLE